MDNEKCFFSHPDGTCGVIVDRVCYGNNIKCNFYKTPQQYADERNRAIMLNRAKGNCEKCKYAAVKCELMKINGDNAMGEVCGR